MRRLLPFVALLACIAAPSVARDWRADQLPNGLVNLCDNCHIPQGRSGPLNLFGEQVQTRFLDRNGNLVWGPELARLDADGDGLTNGEELGDPAGAWREGDPSPGDPQAVTRPWDPDSPPRDPFSVVRRDGWAAVKTYVQP